MDGHIWWENDKVKQTCSFRHAWQAIEHGWAPHCSRNDRLGVGSYPWSLLQGGWKSIGIDRDVWFYPPCYVQGVCHHVDRKGVSLSCTPWPLYNRPADLLRENMLQLTFLYCGNPNARNFQAVRFLKSLLFISAGTPWNYAGATTLWLPNPNRPDGSTWPWCTMGRIAGCPSTTTEAWWGETPHIFVRPPPDSPAMDTWSLEGARPIMAVVTHLLLLMNSHCGTTKKVMNTQTATAQHNFITTA